MAGIEEVSELAKLLRKNGDTVLSGASKLSLSTKLLHNLNDLFFIIVDNKEEFDSSFQVCSSSRNDLFRDLKFLHDFVQKTVWLKVSQSSGDPRLNIDISKFRHLKVLELQKVCIDLVSGIQGVRGQLESISCSGGGGVGTVGRLLASCGRDAGAGFVWPSLKRLVLSYNGLGRLDKSLELAPWLQTLDFSHNLLVNTNELDCLPSLKYVNLGYNRLESSPTFNMATYHTLQVLVLKNNYIQDLNGLQGLDCLAELDLSYNCLTDHSCLWPLETMSALLWVTLEGNPLSYHKKHRLLTIKHLHSALSESKFVLDHEPLNKMEKLTVSRNRISMIRSARSQSKEDLASLTTSVASVAMTECSENPNHMDLTTSYKSEIAEGSEKMITRNRRKKYVSEAIITEDENKDDASSMSVSIISSTPLETSFDHLETKKQILALRKRFGDDKWLSSNSGSFIQDIMGLEKPTMTISEGLDSLQLSSEPKVPPIVESSPKSVAVSNPIHCSTDFSTDSAVGSIESSTDETKDETVVPSSTERLERYEVEETITETDTDKMIEEASPKIVEIPYDPEQEKGELFLVQTKTMDDETQEFFLIITPEEIVERDSITGQVRYRWSTNTVLSCVMGRGDTPTVDFIFDTTRKDRQNRTYVIEKEDATKIVNILGDLIKARPILLKVFKCMKCSTHFSQDPDYVTGITTTSISTIKPPKCPTCRSTLVIQTDELLTPDVEDTKKDGEKLPVKSSTDENTLEGNLQHSGSHSSIGGTEGGAMPVTTSLVQFDSRSQAQVSCSATSLEASRESTPSASTVTKRYESDIEILSNPSQSSIEVLDDGTKASSTPNRKRSSEERRIAIAPNLLTIPDTAPVMAGLTESSSSGSLTDSICTTYENKVARTPGLTGKRQSRQSSESEPASEPRDASSGALMPILTSRLGGLLQSIKIGTPKGSLMESEEGLDVLNSDVEYDYEDFENVDHRIKLHLVLNVFEYENERLRIFLRTNIIMEDTAEPFQGCLVISSSKCYVLKIIGPECGNPQRWLQKETSWMVDEMCSVCPLPFKQGVYFEVCRRNIKHHSENQKIVVVFLLNDMKRTSGFLYELNDKAPSTWDFKSDSPTHCSKILNTLVKSFWEIRYVAFFTLATYMRNENEVKLTSGALIVTQSAILLGKNLQWLLSDTNQELDIVVERAISSLIEVGRNKCTLDFSFIDDVGDVEDAWKIIFVTSDAAEAVISAIEAPWEEFFSVPLQVTIRS